MKSITGVKYIENKDYYMINWDYVDNKSCSNILDHVVSD